MQISELRRLKDLEAENAELKRLLADAMLDSAGLKALPAKTPDACTPPGHCEGADGRVPVQRAAGVQAGWDIRIEPGVSGMPCPARHGRNTNSGRITSHSSRRIVWWNSSAESDFRQRRTAPTSPVRNIAPSGGA